MEGTARNAQEDRTWETHCDRPGLRNSNAKAHVLRGMAEPRGGETWFLGAKKKIRINNSLFNPSPKFNSPQQNRLP